ncbi:MAG: hypothetical protein ABSA27_14030, partial [Terriglobales bacterium]
MKIIALAVLLAIVQAAPPAPRKTADNSTSTTADIQSRSAPDQAKALPAPASAKTDSSGPAKANSSEQHPDDAQHAVGISKLP